MLLSVALVYQEGRKLTEAELRAAGAIVADVRTQIVEINGKAIRRAVRMGTDYLRRRGTMRSLAPSL